MTDVSLARSIPRPLSLRVTPRVVPSGRDVLVHVRIAPDARNRSLEIEWSAASSCRGWHVFLIDSDRGAIRYQHAIRQLAPGEYEVAAVLTRADGTSIRRATSVSVLAS